MTETSGRIEQLLENYSRVETDRQWAILSEFERILEQNPEELEAHLERFLELYLSASGGMQTQWLDFVSDLIMGQPELAIETLRILTDRETGREHGELIFDAAQIAASEQPERLQGLLSETGLATGLDGDPHERESAYELLGYVAGPESAETLLERADIEEGDPQTAAEKALEKTTELAFDRLSAGTGAARAARTLQKLAAERPELLVNHSLDPLYETLVEGPTDAAGAAAEALITATKAPQLSTGLDVWKLVDRVESTRRPAVGRVLGAVAASESDAFVDVITAIVDRLETAESDDGRTVMLASLVEASQLHSEGSFPEIDRILAAGTELTGEHEAQYIRFLGQIAHSASDPGVLVQELVAGLESENPDTRRYAAQGLAEVSLYPVPDALRASTEDPDPAVRQLVDQASDGSPPRIELLGEGQSEGRSRLLGLDVTLKYQTRPGRWDPVDFDEYHHTLLKNTALAYQSGSGGQVLLPYYRPSAGLLIAVELMLGELSAPSGMRIVHYAPGTSHHWGTFKDLREALGRLGFDENTEISGSALPLDDWLTVSRVVDGRVQPYGAGTGRGEIVLVKSLADLSSIGDVDAIVCNLQARSEMPAAEMLDQIQDSTPGAPVFVQWSFFTKHDHGHGWPRYGYPDGQVDGLPTVITRFPVRAIKTGAEGRSGEGGTTPFEAAGHQLARLTKDRSLTIMRVGGTQITDSLATLYDCYKELEGSDADDLASAIQSRLFQIQRLPVPADIYDEWVKHEALSRGPYSPDTTRQLIHSLEKRSDQFDLAYVPATVREAADALEQLFEELATSSPKFTSLVQEINRGLENDDKVAIMFLSSRMVQVFRFGLRKTTDHDPEELADSGIHIGRPDQVRELDSVDRLVLAADVPAALANYYLAPNADATTLLAYRTGIESLVTDWVNKQVQTIHDQLNVPEGVEWPAIPQIETEDVGEEYEAAASEQPVPGVDRDLLRELPESEPEMLTMDVQGETATGSTTDSWTVEITTDTGNRVQLDSSRSVLLRRESPSSAETEHVWVPVAKLTAGDEFSIVPQRIRRELYRETLRELYEEEEEGLDAVNSLHTWWETMRDIYQEHEDVDIIYTLLERQGLEKSKAAVRDWFRAVRGAKKPIELVEYPEFTIGPDSASDIVTIGQTFDRDKFVQQAGVIQNVMEQFRKENQDQGRELNRRIIRMIEDKSHELGAEVVNHEVAEIETLDERS